MSTSRSPSSRNGCPVPVQSLRELGERLVDIHGQHEHQSLIKRELQRQLLDNHGGHDKLLAELADIHDDWKNNQQAMDQIVGAGHDRDSRLEFLKFQLKEFDELAPQPGEVERLHEEHARLANAGQLLATCATHLDRLYDNEQSAQSAISRALSDLEPLTQIDATLKEASELIGGALIQLEEGVNQLRSYQEGLELDPQRLAWVEQRLDALHRLAGKHRIEAETLADFQSRLGQELATLEQADQQMQKLEERRQQLLSRFDQRAAELTRERVKTAAHLSNQVTDIMQSLGMRGGQFKIELSPLASEAMPAHGRDQIEFLVSANPGQPLKPLAKVASGGELSRISLAIQVVAATDTYIPTLIFDEVDSGVGGAVAETVGQQLQVLGKHHQVMCVTHLPQVAAQAKHHLQVSKLTGDKSTRTRIRPLTGDERAEEIARMLGGQKITDSTRRHAREMLQLGTTGPRKKKAKT